MTVLRQNRNMLQRPSKILTLCLIVVFSTLLFDWTFLRLWSLRGHLHQLETKLRESKARSLELEKKIREASLPEFIEREARNQLDLVKENDLIFIFSDDSPSAE